MPSEDGVRTTIYGCHSRLLDDFFLTVELEDNTPDATPPVVESSAHYTDLTSYVAGARTLYIALLMLAIQYCTPTLLMDQPCTTV